VLRYDERSFVLFNQSDGTVDVSNIEFVQNTPAGEVVAFSSWDWTGGDPPYALRAGRCYQLVALGTTDPPVPPFCEARASWQGLGPRRMFWVNEDPEATFIVRREGEVLATCQVSEPECYVPLD
jgi:hypothetical protein